jgi:mannose-6-phosphate isomerase-like protein (cupin superfamily)
VLDAPKATPPRGFAGGVVLLAAWAFPAGRGERPLAGVMALRHPTLRDGPRDDERASGMAEVTYQRGDSDNRPWGRWEVLETGDGFAVKRITVNPGAILSLQLHHHREEHWVIVKGRARVTRGEQILELNRNQGVFIPVETAHRIENPGSEMLEFIEVQVGDKLDENDIVRLEDRYGRVAG